jgi:cytochrome c oxidase assembly factor CtaG
VLLTLALVFIAVAYLRGWISLRSNSSGQISTWRACSFLVGLFAVWVAVASPLSGLDHELLTVHMLKHLLLMTVAPSLIWLGEPVRCIACTFPPVILLTKLTTLHQIGSGLAKPQVGWLAAAAALVVWHIPAVFTLAMQSTAWHFVEQSSFLLAGLLFWWPVVQPWPSVSRPDLSMILYLFFATLPCDILSGFLVFCDRVIYPHYLSSSHLLGFSALADQQCAAAFMWTSVTLIYLVAGTILAMHLLSPEKSPDPELIPTVLQVNAAPAKVQQRVGAF